MKPILATMLSISGNALTDDEKRILEKANPVGITLFKRNVVDKNQLQMLVRSLKETIGRADVLIGVDQEGGRVQRLTSPIWNVYASQSALGSLPKEQALQAVRLHAQLIAADLREVGINLNYSPVLDIVYPETTIALKSRIFSDDEKQVASLGAATLDSYQQNGICACIKHLPGHGHAVVDPHFDLPIIEADLNTLEKDFFPFISVRTHALSGMTGHIVLKALDDKPVTQSKKIIQNLIRNEIGFNGFLFSDAIDMHALRGTLAEKTQSCLQAGCDAVCYCSGQTTDLIEVINAACPLTDEALDRFDQIKKIFEISSTNQNNDVLCDAYLTLIKQAKHDATDYDVVESLN